jgi:Mg-chelatase subunit ChlD
LEFFQPTGGGTPFADSLLQAWQLIRSERLKNSGICPILAIISDGEATIPISAGSEPPDELEALTKNLARDRIPAIFIDAATKKKGESEMCRLAEVMRG